ncbi:MAG: methyltransferase domain-containing protein [Deltaproteobacteria bacterium]|nr:methyltransferase domain-containing protein [Deltaproteobacteria bacterium]
MQKAKGRKRDFWRIFGGSVLFVLWLGSGTVGAQEHHPHHPLPLDQYIALLEDPKRDEWQKPDAVIEALHLQNVQTVADIGAGSGYFTLRLARAVGQHGTVFALDVDEGMLGYLRQRLVKESITNVKVVQVPAHDPLLIDGSVDLAFICNTYHHLEEREVYLRKLRKGLKPDGRLVIVDFYKREGIPVGPPMSMRLSEETVQKELQAAGLKVTEKLTLLPYQYILIAQPTTEAHVASPAAQP